MRLGMGKLAVLLVALVIGAGGVGAALADWRDSDTGTAIELAADEMRKNENDDEIAAAVSDDDEGDGDRTRGDDGTNGGNNTGDGDWTAGNDGTGGGDNSYAPAPAPNYGGGGGDWSDDGGGGTDG